LLKQDFEKNNLKRADDRIVSPFQVKAMILGLGGAKPFAGVRSI
jgi:hypothetical protein